MKSYIGTKIVQAEPMTMKDFERQAARFIGGNEAEGYKVVYEDGYTSWSPKETFERAYREVTLAEKALIGQGD